MHVSEANRSPSGHTRLLKKQFLQRWKLFFMSKCVIIHKKTGGKAMNRKNRRHPSHPFLPREVESKRSIRDCQKLMKSETSSKGFLDGRNGRRRYM